MLQITVHVLAGVLLQALVREGGEISLRAADMPPKRVFLDAGLTGSGDEVVPKTLLGGVFCCLMFWRVL